MKHLPPDRRGPAKSSSGSRTVETQEGQTYLAELEAAIKRACDDTEPDVKVGLAAAIAVCEEWKDRLLVTIRAANRRHGIRHADLVLLCDLPSELQALNWQYGALKRRIDDIREVMSRVVLRPDGETMVLPRGQSFAGFSEDGKVISGRSTVVVDEAAEHAHHTAQRAKIIEQYGSEEAYREHCVAEGERIRAARREAFRRERNRRDREHRPDPPRSSSRRRAREHRPGTTRRAASSSSTSSADPPDADSEPPRRRGCQLRHVSCALTAFLRAIGGGAR